MKIFGDSSSPLIVGLLVAASQPFASDTSGKVWGLNFQGARIIADLSGQSSIE
jgi:hypothetical protein